MSETKKPVPAKKKESSKVAGRRKYNKHRLLTFSRMIKYGFDSFFRNSWLSLAATIVMTITLLIIFASVIVQNVLSDTLGELRNKVDMSIYLKTDTSDETGKELVAEVQKLSSVRSATFVSSSEARAKMANENSDNVDVLSAIKEATNKTPSTLRVVVEDINNTQELEDFVNNNELVKANINSDYAPSFAGERRNTIQSIGRVVSFAQKIGIAAAILFVAISALIIFNTIRMAIFNRKEEIEMMKLIGANRSFIIGPFLVESVIYGIIAAILATGIGILVLWQTSNTLNSYQIAVQPTIDLLTVYWPVVLACMMLVGAIIGIISSLFATSRYLKK